MWGSFRSECGLHRIRYSVGARWRHSHYEGLAHNLLGDLPEDDLARCRAVITTLEECLDDLDGAQRERLDPGRGLSALFAEVSISSR